MPLLYLRYLWFLDVLAVWPYIARAEPAQDHARALRASFSRLPEYWRRPRGCPRVLATNKADLEPLNFGLYTSCLRAADHSTWRGVVETIMEGAPLNDDDDDD